MRRISIGILGNGMRYYSQYDSGGASHLSGIGVKCGAIHAPPGYVGLPHLVEHLMARKSNKHDGRTVDLMIEKFMGGPDGDVNIRIDRCSTFFGHDNLLRRRHMMECFDMIAHMIRDKIVDCDGISVEKAAIHQEYYLYGLDNMPGLIDDLMHEIVYTKNPARKRVDCLPDDLKKVSISQIRNLIKKYYTPENMFVIMLGPTFQEVSHLVKEYFEDWNSDSGPSSFRYARSDEFPQLRNFKIGKIVRSGIHQFHAGIGFPTETFSSKDCEAIDILARVWEFRLRQRLREDNRNFDEGVYRVLAYTPRTFAHGMMYVWFATKSRSFFQEAREIVIEEAQKLKRDLIHEDELDAMVSNLDYAYLDAFRNSSGVLCELIIDHACNGDEDLIGLHSFRERLYKVTRRKVRDAANKYFTKHHAEAHIYPRPG